VSLPYRVEIHSKQNKDFKAAVIHLKTGETNMMLEFQIVNAGGILDGHASSPDGRTNVLFKLARRYEHVAFHKTGRQLAKFSKRKEFHGEFPIFLATAAFDVALNEKISAENLSEAREFTRTGFAEHYEDLRVDWSGGVVWDWEDSVQWQCRLKTDEIASFAIWLAPNRGSCGNWTKWRGANYWWHAGRLETFKISDLFEPGVSWELQVRRFCSEEFRRQEFYGAAQGVLEPAVEVDAFTVSPSGLQVYFNPYSLGSGADGEFIVHIPYAALRSFFRKNGPVCALPINVR